MDQFDPWQAVLRQVFTPYSCVLILLISTAFVADSCVGCLRVTVVDMYSSDEQRSCKKKSCI